MLHLSLWLYVIFRLPEVPRKKKYIIKEDKLFIFDSFLSFFFFFPVKNKFLNPQNVLGIVFFFFKVLFSQSLAVKSCTFYHAISVCVIMIKNYLKKYIYIYACKGDFCAKSGRRRWGRLNLSWVGGRMNEQRIQRRRRRRRLAAGEIPAAVFPIFFFSFYSQYTLLFHV